MPERYCLTLVAPALKHHPQALSPTAQPWYKNGEHIRTSVLTAISRLVRSRNVTWTNKGVIYLSYEKICITSTLPLSQLLYLSLPDVIFRVVAALTTHRPVQGSTMKVTREQEKEEVARYTFRSSG